MNYFNLKNDLIFSIKKFNVKLILVELEDIKFMKKYFYLL